MVTLTFSALSSGFPLPCRQQDPQRAAPWSCSSSGGCHTRGSSQPLSQTAAPHNSHICGRKEGVQRHTDVTQELKHRIAPLFAVCTSHLPWISLFLQPPPVAGGQGSPPRAQQHKHINSPAQTAPALGWDQTLTQTKWWGLYQGETCLLTPANPFHMDQTAMSLFTLRTTSLHKKCLFSWWCSGRRIQSKHGHKSCLQISKRITNELLQQTWAKLQPSKAKRVKTISVSNQLDTALLCLLVMLFKWHIK